MNKINYDKHDWVDREPITQTLFNNIEGGIGRTTSSTNLLVDRTNQEEESLSTIEGKIEHQDMEFDIAIDEHDTLDERLKADVSRFVEVWSGGNYMSFEGKNIRIDNSKVGWIRDFSMKGETYQNLINTNSDILFAGSSNCENIINSNSKREVKALSDGSMVLYKNGMFKDNTTYTVVANVFVSRDIPLTFSFNSEQGFKNLSPIKVGDYATYIVPITTTTNCTSVVIGNHGDFLTNDVLGIEKLMVFEGDYTNKEIPSSYIDGIVGAGELKDDGQYEIEILSHNENLLYNPLIEKNCYYSYNNGNKKVVDDYDSYKAVVKPNTQYSIFPQVAEISNVTFWDNNNNFIKGLLNDFTFITPSNCSYIKFAVGHSVEKVMLNLGIQKSIYIEPKQDKTQILLDEPLMKLPNGVCDEITKDGKLIRRVGKIILNGSEQWRQITSQPNTNTLYCHNILPSKSDSVICDKFKTSDTNSMWNFYDNEAVCQESLKSIFHIRINRTRLTSQDVNGLKQWLSDNPITVYYELKTPIETQLDLDMSKWLTYQDVTYFTTTCNVQPTLSLKAPVDIQATVSNLQATNLSLRRNNQQLEQENQQAEKELNTLQEQCDQQTADLLDMDMRVLMLEE